MRILITGAGGFVGSHLMDAYPEAVGFDNWLTGRHENCPRVETLDILERQRLYAHANVLKPEVVIHCAASYSDPNLWHRDTDTNVSGCINAAAVAKHHGAHLVYFQTILPPVSSYAISKIAGEQYLRLSGVPLTVLRLANMYGPRNISGPIPVFFRRLTEGLPTMVVDTTRDFVFISDLVEAVTKVVTGRLTGTFDVCSGKQTPIYEIYEAIMGELDLARMSYPLVPPDPDDVQGQVDPWNGVPGWAPRTPLWQGIKRTIASYRETGVEDTFTHLRLKT